MTLSPKRPCKSPGCPALVGPGQGTYCDSHQRIGLSVSKAADRARGSAASRGYDADWQRARLAFLARWPLCAGVLLPTADWTKELAIEFHHLREAEREKGHLLIFDRMNKINGIDSVNSVQKNSVPQWLDQNPIYTWQPWDQGRPATVVDHIVPHHGDYELMWSEWNWQPLTKRAHDRKTATETKRGQRGDGASFAGGDASPEPGSEGERVTLAGCPPEDSSSAAQSSTRHSLSRSSSIGRLLPPRQNAELTRRSATTANVKMKHELNSPT